jgi:hypothetical protein
MKIAKLSDIPVPVASCLATILQSLRDGLQLCKTSKLQRRATRPTGNRWVEFDKDWEEDYETNHKAEQD